MRDVNESLVWYIVRKGSHIFGRGRRKRNNCSNPENSCVYVGVVITIVS